MIILPTLQKSIRKAFMRLVLLFGGLGLILVMAIFITGRIPAKLVRMNYDSIAHAEAMLEAMTALHYPALFSDDEAEVWRSRFEEALGKAAQNITEPDEPKAIAAIDRAWSAYRASPDDASYAELRKTLNQLVTVNENGMFRRLDENTRIRDITMLCAAALFLIGTLWAILLADSVSTRISHPLRRVAELFRNRPQLGTLLHLPEPQTFEVRILFDELQRLWLRLSDLDAINVESLRASMGKLHVILESADDAILVLDANGSVVHVSLRMAGLLCLPVDDILGKPWNDLSTAVPAYIALRDALTEDMQGLREIELELDGEQHFFSIRRRDLVSGGGQISGQVFLLADVTERHQRDTLRSEMMDWVSHELKTPMQSMGLAVDLLVRRRQSLDAETTMLVETLREDIVRLRIVARQFMEVSRMSQAALCLSTEKIDLAAQLEGWLKPFALVAREAGVSLHTVLPPSPLPVELDPERFAWVVSNLVSNALRLTPQGSAVSIALMPEAGGARLIIEDEGPGLPTEVEARIFQPYSHGQAAGRREGLTGLGLAITHDIVEAHGGSIAYSRRSPSGARFDVFLPGKE